MRIRNLFAAALAVTGLPGWAATAEVEFVNPASFTDAGRPHPAVDRDASLGALKDHLVSEAARRLPADESLYVAITDVDLAGAFEPRQPYYRETRVVKEIYPPRIDLRFRLMRADGTVVKEGARTLRDTAFLTGRSIDREDALRYEKVMLERWLESEFGSGR